MSAGFQCWNANGVATIDESYINLHLMGAGTVWCGNVSWANQGIQYTDIGYSGGTFPVLVLYKGEQPNRPDVGATILGCYQSGSNWTWRVACFGRGGVANGTDMTVSYYIYDRPRIQGNGVGLEVFGGDGGLVFSSAYRPMKSAGSNGGVWKYGFSYLSGISVVNDTYDTSENGHTVWRDRYRVDLTGWRCNGAGVFSTQFTYGFVDGRLDPTPDYLETGGGATQVDPFFVNLNNL